MSGRAYRTTRNKRTTRSEVPTNVVSGTGSQGSFSPPPPGSPPYLQADFSDETQYEGWGFW